MEQKRTIWIVLAAGIFLCVVLGAAVILYSAEARKNTTALQKRGEGSVWMSPELAEQNTKNDLYASSGVRTESTKLPELAKSEGLQEIPASSSRPVDAPATKAVETPSARKDEANVFAATPPATSSAPTVATSAAINADQSANGLSSENVTVIATGKTNVYNMGETSTTTIDLNDLSAYKKDESASSNVTAQNKVAATAIRETSSAHKSTQATPKKVYEQPKAQASSTSSKAVAQKKSAPAKPAPVAATQTTTNRFWVQAGSFTTTKNADEARSELESNKIPCEVFTSDVSGVLHYRVRVGPYTTKSEAEYWKQRIDEIPLFSKSGSFVTSTKSTS